MKKLLLTLLSLTFFYAGGRFANAGTHVWSGALNGYWSNPANWSSGGAPSAIEAAPVVVQFPSTASARRESTNDLAYLKLDVLAFYGGNYRLYGEESTLRTLTLTGSQPPFPYTANLISGYSSTNYIDWWLNLALSTNVSILVGSGATLELDAAMIGPGGFTKTGTGTLWLSGEVVHPAVIHNSFKGPALVLDGVVKSEMWGYNDYFDYLGHPVVTIPGELTIGDANMAHTPKVQVAAEGQLGGGAVTINPNGFLELLATTTIGSLGMTGGTVQFVPDWLATYPTLHCGTNITSYPTPLGTATIAGQGELEIQTAVAGQPSSISVLSDRMILEANIRGQTTLSKVGPGELVWSGDGEYFQGQLLIQQGHLAYSGLYPFSFPADPAYSATVSDGAQLTLRSACSGVQLIHLNGFGLGGTNGALVIEHDGASFAASMQFDSDTAIVVTNASHTFTVNGSNAGGIRQHFQGSGDLYKKGPGTLKITGDQTNSMTGKFFVEQGTLALNNQVGVPAVNSPLIIGLSPADGTTAEVKLLNHSQISPGAPITIRDSGTLNLNGNLQTIGPLTLMGGDIKTGAGMLTLSADVLATNGLGSVISGYVHLGATKPTFHIAPGYGVNFVAQVADIGSSVGFDLDGGGLLTLSGPNTPLYGPIHVKAGVLYARNDSALGNTSGGTTISAGGRLAIDGRNLGAEPITLTGDGENGYGALSCARTNTLTGPIVLAGDCALNVVSPTDRLILGGVVSGPGALNHMGYGTLEMTGNYANTYSGRTTVTDGTLELTKSGNVSVPAGLVVGNDASPATAQIVRILSANQLGHNGPVTVRQSGLLDLSGAFFAPQTLGSLTGGGRVNLGVSPLSVGADNTDTSYGGFVTGTGSLIKEGTGTWSLAVVSDLYQGTTVVNAGTLKTQNSIPNSPVTVNAGGKLAGNGTVGNVTSVGGTVDPGCCPAYMKLSSKNLSLDSASVFRAELLGTNNGAFVYASQANISGTANLGNATLKATLGFNSTVGNKFTIIDNDGVENITGTFKGLAEGATFPVGKALMQITYTGGTGNDVVLTHIGSVAAPQIGSVESLPNGQKKITGTGYPGLTYTVEASTDLKSWLEIGTATAASPGGELSFVDPDAPNFPYRFYRFMAP